jgi:sulfopyruvate decarboxylase TPP-binding subunit
MFDGPGVLQALKSSGITHVVWIPDSELGTWENSLRSDPELKLIRVCRESEAIVLAAGLMLGGKQPVVVIQCTGLFDAGDALRNVVHDMRLPLFLICGLRGYYAHQRGPTSDTCPIFAEPILRAWQIPYVLLTGQNSVADLKEAYRRSRVENRAGAVFLAE